MTSARRLTLRMLLGSGAAVGLVMAGVAAPAQAVGVACGDTLTASAALTSDLTCEGDGLHIAASNVTLDLRGFTIRGSGGGTGIRVDWGGSYSGVTILNGSVRDFDAGVVLDTAAGVRVTQVSIDVIGRGITFANTSGSMLDRSTVRSRTWDAVKVDGDTNVITQNSIVGGSFGIAVSNGGKNNQVTQNVVSGIDAAGIAVFDAAADTTVAQNKVTGANWGLVVAAGAAGTKVSRNTITAARTDGLWVEASTTATSLTQNTSYANARHGILVESSSATLTKNLAYGNGGAGIVAFGATDGGGNKAYGNGSPCSGVVCSLP